MLVIVLAATAAALLGLALASMAWSIVHPPRMTDGKAAYVLGRVSPGDLQLPYEPVTFTVRDARRGGELTLAAWWIASAELSDVTVMLLHGYGDAKVGAIAWAPPWHALGVNVLALDLRAHGESAGRLCAGGVYESDDVAQVIAQWRAMRPDTTRKLILMGISLGALVAAATAVQGGAVDAVVMDSPIGDFAGAAGHLARATDLALPGLMPPAVRLAGRVTGVNFPSVNPARTIGRIRVPLLLIQSGRDVLTPQAIRKQLRAVALERDGGEATTLVWEPPEAAHTQALRVDAPGYVQKLAALMALLRSG